MTTARLKQDSHGLTGSTPEKTPLVNYCAVGSRLPVIIRNVLVCLNRCLCAFVCNGIMKLCVECGVI
jgi:hypothetical protein